MTRTTPIRRRKDCSLQSECSILRQSPAALTLSTSWISLCITMISTSPSTTAPQRICSIWKMVRESSLLSTPLKRDFWKQEVRRMAGTTSGCAQIKRTWIYVGTARQQRSIISIFSSILKRSTASIMILTWIVSYRKNMKQWLIGSRSWSYQTQRNMIKRITSQTPQSLAKLSSASSTFQQRESHVCCA